MLIEILKSFVYGVLEGITEWLPVSSTGHLILLQEILPMNIAPELGAAFSEEYLSMFEVVIQLGAILAVVVTFFRKLNPFAPSKSSTEKKITWLIWSKIVIASIPSAFIGLVLDKVIEKLSGKDIDGWLYNWQTVAATLIIYGILFIVVERIYKNKSARCERVEDISFSQAAIIGGFQALAIIPGTSRSGATVLGSRIFGVSRGTAAEFSFFLGVPAMAGASLIKGGAFLSYVLETDVSVPAIAWIVLAIACATAFAVSMVAIRFLLEFVKKHSFSPFGVYRIILGALVIIFFTFR